MLRWMSWWPPFLGMGIKVRRISDDFREADVEMVQRFWNTNYVGVHFGGSLFAMTDPFYMLMLIEILGPGYIVWDKGASIRFRRPGKGTVRAEFRLTEEQIDEVRQAAETEAKVDRAFAVEIKDASGDVVAVAERVVHVRKKQGAATSADLWSNPQL